MTLKSNKIREIIEKHATDDNNEWADVYKSIKDWHFDKLEIDLVEWERRSNQLAVQEFMKKQRK